MSIPIIVNIEADEQGHCDLWCRMDHKCGEWWCDLFDEALQSSYPDDPMLSSEGPPYRLPACLAAEKKLADLIEAAQELLTRLYVSPVTHEVSLAHDTHEALGSIKALRQALAAIKEKP